MPLFNPTKPGNGWAEVEIPHPGWTPSSPIVWPANRQRSNQIQQTKTAAKPQQSLAPPTVAPNQSLTQSRTTPGMVSNVRVVTRPAVNGQKTVTVQFTHPGNDPYFAGAHVYLRQAGNNTQPALVAGGAASPLTFTVPVNQAPHVLHVTSFGNWGETDVMKSPASPVRLV